MPLTLVGNPRKAVGHPHLGDTPVRLDEVRSQNLDQTEFHPGSGWRTPRDLSDSWVEISLHCYAFYDER